MPGEDHVFQAVSAPDIAWRFRITAFEQLGGDHGTLTVAPSPLAWALGRVWRITRPDGSRLVVSLSHPSEDHLTWHWRHEPQPN